MRGIVGMNGMELLKRTAIALLLVCLLATFAQAVRGTADVSNTLHNLSTSGPFFSFYTTDESQVCIFCHTPHGGNNTGPLWNKANPANPTLFYRSSTVSAVVNGVNTINAESLLCLSCHDGSISVNALMNYGDLAVITTNANSQTDTTIVGTPGASSRIGGNPGNVGGTGLLDDDHPISFSYFDVLAEPGVTGLHSIANAITAGVEFFGAAGAGGDRVECSSCHDPHVDYETGQFEYAPFLITPNTGSALCLACHDK